MGQNRGTDRRTHTHTYTHARARARAPKNVRYATTSSVADKKKEKDGRRGERSKTDSERKGTLRKKHWKRRRTKKEVATRDKKKWVGGGDTKYKLRMWNQEIIQRICNYVVCFMTKP